MTIKPLEASCVPSMTTRYGLILGADVTLLPIDVGGASTTHATPTHSSEASTIAKVFQQAGLPTTIAVTPSGSPPSIVQRSASWIGPTIFISAMYLSQNPDAVSLALSVMGNYLTDIFRGQQRECVVRFKLFADGVDGCRGVEYEGPIVGIAEVRAFFDSPPLDRQ